MNAPTITLHQPWASILAVGRKTIETRSWGTSYRGPLRIHAGAHVPRAGDCPPGLVMRDQLGDLNYFFGEPWTEEEQSLSASPSARQARPVGLETMSLYAAIAAGVFLAAGLVAVIWRIARRGLWRNVVVRPSRCEACGQPLGCRVELERVQAANDELWSALEQVQTERDVLAARPRR